MFPLENSTEDLKFPGKLFVFNNAELVQENSVSGEKRLPSCLFGKGRTEILSLIPGKKICPLLDYKDVSIKKIVPRNSGLKR